MILRLIVMFWVLSAPVTNVPVEDGRLVMFWNLENFFDFTDSGTGESDSDFSATGSRRWTKGRFYKKCSLIAKGIFSVGDMYGRMPDVVGVCEVENREVLSRMLSSTALQRVGYGIVHRESSDRRGIDVALLYRKDVYKVLSVSLKHPENEGVRMKTRDILCVTFQDKESNSIVHYLVNHHPSKFSGKGSESSRVAVMQALRQVCDSLESVSEAPIIAMGDFNDTPDGEQFSIITPCLENKAAELFKKGEGTIRYKGKWDLIDMFLVSPSISQHARMEIVKIPYLMEWDNVHPGEKPLRTYSGPRYLGGVSDHCPIVLEICP